MSEILVRVNRESFKYDYVFRYMDAAEDFLMCFTKNKTQRQHDLYRKCIARTISATVSDLDIIRYCWDCFYDKKIFMDTRDLERSDPEGLLAAAAAVSNSSAVKYLLPKVANTCKPSKMLGDALTAAAINSQVCTASLLYKLSTNPTVNTERLWNAIAACMEQDSPGLIPRLLDWLNLWTRADLDDKKKRNLRDWAIVNGSVHVLRRPDALWKIPCHSGMRSSKFKQACKYGQAEVIEYFVYGYVPERPLGTKMQTLLLTQGLRIAVEHGWLVAAESLITAGADVNGQYDEYSRRTDPVLDVAVYHGHVTIVKMLLDNGARVLSDAESTFSTSTMTLAQDQGGEIAKVISMASGQEWKLSSPERPVTQVSRVYDDITALADDMRDLYLRG
jgi:hypothetical protein